MLCVAALTIADEWSFQTRTIARLIRSPSSRVRGRARPGRNEGHRHRAVRLSVLLIPRMRRRVGGSDHSWLVGLVPVELARRANVSPPAQTPICTLTMIPAQ